MDARKIIGIIVASLVLALGLAACGNENKEPDMGVTTEMATTETSPELPDKRFPYGTPEYWGVTKEQMEQEREPVGGLLNVGDKTDFTTNAKTGAKAYTEIYNAGGNDEKWRTVIEYRDGRKTEVTPYGSAIQFSPDGKYLLYWQINDSGKWMRGSFFLYDIEKKTSKELHVFKPNTRESPTEVPESDDSTIVWKNDWIDFKDPFGTAWQIIFNP